MTKNVALITGHERSLLINRWSLEVVASSLVSATVWLKTFGATSPISYSDDSMKGQYYYNDRSAWII